MVRRPLVALLLSLGALALVGCGSSTREEDPDPEICDNGADDDGDGLVDCDDLSCALDPGCEGRVEICDNDADDDGDELVDCDDSSCASSPACVGQVEICDNGADDDGDGRIDCNDPSCFTSPLCEGELCYNGADDDGDDLVDCDDPDCETSCCETMGDESIACDDECDNDLDGLIDCEDDDCDGEVVCETPVEICDNDADDDGDDLVDCDDGDCADDPSCEAPVEDCDNDADDDGDDLVDCDDGDCADDPSCQEVVEICDNDIDDDDDGLTDCDDPTCDGSPACEEPVEICDNGDDDDGDSLADCDDPDCDAATNCLPADEVCDNGVDDDEDGATDCGDSDCAGDPACQEDCDNDEDDDADGLVDCFDPSCDYDLACAELCNGIDDDGDGRIDENPIEPSVGDICYEGPPAAAGVGQCDEGVVECFDGSLECRGWVAPMTAELCDGIDNDCDGVIPAEEDDCGSTVTPGDPTTFEISTEIRDVDVHLNLDTTGSMYEELTTLRTTLGTTIVPEIRDVLPTSAFGLSSFGDFPVSPFGSSGDWPYDLSQRITTNVGLVQSALEAMDTQSGGDGPEAGVESLFQIATGAGVTWATSWSPEDCDSYASGDEDGDGLANCDDPDCYDHPSCEPDIAPEGCFDFTDNDGDGYVDCDDPDCVYGGDIFCTLYMTPGPCGNSTINTGEQCDDGNTSTGDGCDETCQLEPGCGNALTGASEECDDGNRDDGDGCSSTCEIEADPCGNGVTGWGEQCDDGDTAPGDGCDENCLLEPDCGNDALSPDEECDDGNRINGDGCENDCTVELEGLPRWNWTVGFDADLGHGPLGGVGFRTTAMPVVVHITDALSHGHTEYRAAGINAHAVGTSYLRLAGLGIRVVGVWTDAWGTTPADPTNRLHPLGMAVTTGAVVPICAFDGSAPRLGGLCDADECCTGAGGSGVLPIGGECPLYFDIGGSGDSLDSSIVTALEALSRFASYTISISPRDDAADGVDARCFVESIAVAGFAAPSDGCTADPVPVDGDGDGVEESLEGATPLTRASFEVSVVNQDWQDLDEDGDTSEPCSGPGTYGLFLDVVTDGGAVISTRRVEVVIP